MGYVLCHSECCICHRFFAYNPHKVPSTSIFTGEREPVCQSCMNRLNAKRKDLGLEPFPIHPDAYQPLPEEEL